MSQDERHRCRGHNISLPGEMYAAVNAVAEERRWTRSQVIREAVRRYLSTCEELHPPGNAEERP